MVYGKCMHNCSRKYREMQKKAHGPFVSRGNSEMVYLPPRVPHRGVSTNRQQSHNSGPNELLPRHDGMLLGATLFRVSLCSPGSPGTHSVDPAGL